MTGSNVDARGKAGRTPRRPKSRKGSRRVAALVHLAISLAIAGIVAWQVAVFLS